MAKQAAPRTKTKNESGSRASDIRELTPKPSPTHDDIALRAFRKYQARAEADGDALSDWLLAEAELSNEPG